MATQIRFGSRVETVHGERGLVSECGDDYVRIWVYASENPYALGMTRTLRYTEVVTLPVWRLITDAWLTT